MPYVNPEIRRVIDVGCDPSSPGELNYRITSEIMKYMGKQKSYSKFNEVVGVLECAKLELYRRMIAPYEDQKCFDNGDVYNA